MPTPSVATLSSCPSSDCTPRHITPEENVALALYVAAHGSMDAAGTVGFLHAIASSPTMIPFAEWAAVLHPDTRGMDADAVADFHDLLCVAINAIGFQLAIGRPHVPDSSNEAECASFARGYLAGMELWPSVLGPDRFCCAAWACAVAGRFDLLPPSERARLQVTPDEMVSLRREIGCLMVLTFDLLADGPAEEPASTHGSRALLN